MSKQLERECDVSRLRPLDPRARDNLDHECALCYQPMVDCVLISTNQHLWKWRLCQHHMDQFNSGEWAIAWIGQGYNHMLSRRNIEQFSEQAFLEHVGVTDLPC